MMKYFRILDDLTIRNRWFLGVVNLPEGYDIWDFVTVSEIPAIKEPLAIEVSQEGDQLDLTMGEFEVLVANEVTAGIFSEQEVMKLPARVLGKKETPFFILKIKHELDGIDRSKSEFTLWEPDNDIRPDLAGTYETFTKMVVDPEATEGLDIFRIKDFNVAVIVSERVKTAFEKMGLRGVRFKQV